MRNHAVQYSAEPGFGWYKLRREWPFVYESYAEIEPEKWTHLKIEVAGRVARLYVNGSTKPSLVVDGAQGSKPPRRNWTVGLPTGGIVFFKLADHTRTGLGNQEWIGCKRGPGM